MKDKRSCQRDLLSLTLIVLALAGWLYLPDRFPVSPGPSASAATSMTFTVTDAGDAGCPNPLGRNCTLRQVIIAANSNPGLDTIRFNITGGPGPVKTITPTSELPEITDPVIIDGTTQPGYAGQPLIELSGASAGAANGLVISAGGSIVKGLVINRYSSSSSSGILIQTNGGNTIEGNYIGTNAAGTASAGNRNGILITGTSSNNIVGGTTPAARNVIAGNAQNVQIAATGNTVQGNFIGTNSFGQAGIPGNVGVFISANNNLVERNVISGNGGAGVVISGTGNLVQFNFVGTNASGSGPLGNGVGVDIGGDDNSVLSNTIAFSSNQLGGVRIQSGGTGNSILGNSIFSNNGLGIDLLGDGVTPNDAGDADTGANNLQNFPILTLARYSVGILTIAGRLDRLPGNYRLQFFSSTSCDASGNGEGESFLMEFTSGGSGGVTSFSRTMPAPLPAGRFITATATKLDTANNPTDTSEFSPCIPLLMPGGVQFSSASYSVSEGGGTAAITINRVGGSDGLNEVIFSTSNGTATAGQDYTATGTLVFFADGETSKTIFVPITDDSSIESAETVNLTLSVTITGSPPLGTPSTAVLTIGDNDSGSMVHFSNSSYTGSEDCAAVIVSVDRIGDSSGVSTINYSTTSGTASDRADFTATTGTLRFAPGDAQKSFVILVNEDSHTEGTETASITLSNPSGASLGAPSIATLSILDDSSEPATNANDDSVKFVCQHYHDFLNRQPDAGGQAFWINEIESCGTDAQCRAIKRVNVSAAFFLSIEFQQTGYLVYRIYKTAYGNMPGAPVPLTLQEFLPDTQAIGLGVQVGIGDWQTLLENNKNAFASEFVTRIRFTNAFPAGMTAAQFVDALNANSSGALSPSERNQLVNELTSGAKTRAQVLRAIAEDQTLAQSEFNKAFVLMQYFGYLRRNPNSVPDSDFAGYNFWLQKLNQFGGNFVDAEMVKSFLVAGEYRLRFGP